MTIEALGTTEIGELLGVTHHGVLSLIAGRPERTGWLVVAEDGTSTHFATLEAVPAALRASGTPLARVVCLDRVGA